MDGNLWMNRRLKYTALFLNFNKLLTPFLNIGLPIILCLRLNLIQLLVHYSQIRNYANIVLHKIHNYGTANPLIWIILDHSSDGKNEARKSRIWSTKMAATRLPVNRNHGNICGKSGNIYWPNPQSTLRSWYRYIHVIYLWEWQWTWSNKMAPVASNFY